MCSWSFNDVRLSEFAIQAVEQLGFKEPLPVQKAVIPLLLNSKDVAVEAITGSGKTVAFLIPVLEILNRRISVWKSNEIGALVISPTYELALQLYEVLSSMVKHYVDNFGRPRFTTLVFTGGGGSGGLTTRVEDVANFERNGATILVATPGRLVDIIRHVSEVCGPTSNLFVRGFRSLEILILDEADRLLEMGFERQLNILLSMLPKQRRTGLFSATQTNRVEDLVRAGLRNPVRVVVSEQVTSDKTLTTRTTDGLRTPVALQNFYVLVEPEAKFSILIRFLLAHSEDKMLIFLATCACVDYFSRLIRQLVSTNQAKTIHALHGKLRKKRTAIFNTFRQQTSGALICTDVMARGVDIPRVSWVLQCDPPTSTNVFVHRCGRTARCGAEGHALLFLTPKEVAYVDFLAINQKVHLTELSSGDLDKLCVPDKGGHLSPNSIISRIRRLCKRDKLLYEKSIRAFVSYIQFYRKHECHLLLRLSALNLGLLGNAFGLLKLPRMPELRDADTSAFDAPSIDVTKLKYREKSVAKQRELLKAKELEEKEKWKIHKKNKPWSKAKEARQKKAEKRQKRLLKTPEKQHSGKCPRQFDPEDDDLEELNEDYRLLKRIRKRKATEAELDSD